MLAIHGLVFMGMVYISTRTWTSFIQFYMQFSCIENTFNMIQQKQDWASTQKTNVYSALARYTGQKSQRQILQEQISTFLHLKMFSFILWPLFQTPRILWTHCTLHFVQKLCGYQCPSESEVFSMKTTYNLAGERTEAWTALSQTKDFLSGRNSLRLAWVAGLTSGQKENPIPILRCWWRALFSVCYLTPYTAWYISSPLPIFVFWQGSKMPFHICSSTFKTHGDPLFRKIGKVPSSKSHAEAHSSDSLPTRFRIISLWVSVLCYPWLARVPEWVFFSYFFLLSSLQPIHFPPAFSSSMLVPFSFSFLFPVHSLQHAISPFPHAFCFCPVPSALSPFSSAPLFASHFSALLLAEDY